MDSRVMRQPLYYEALRWLTHHRLAWEVVMSGGVFGTLALEISFPYLAWKRELRWLMVLGSVMLHTFIAVFMGLATFGLLMMALVLSFVPPKAVHRLFEKQNRAEARNRTGLLSRLWVRHAA
jgi:hypothetical protein